MLLSVVISTYNQDRYIAQCIDSVIDALPPGDVEIIIVDDCSRDKTPEVVGQYVTKYPELISYIRSEKNAGANANYLRGHRMARGQYVAHIDGDDLALNKKFADQVLLMETDSTISLIFHRAEYFSDDGIVRMRTGPLFLQSKVSYFSRRDLAAWGPICVHSSFMYRRDALNLDKIVIPFMEWQIAMLCLEVGRGAYINEFLVRYRNNSDSAAITATSVGRLWTYEVHAQNVQLFFQQCPSLRRPLYAQALFNMVVQLKSKHRVSKRTIVFLFRNLAFFSPIHLCRTLQVRNMLRPRPVDIR